MSEPWGGRGAWYAAARSDEIARGVVLTRRAAGVEIMLFRGASGAVFAMEPHCSHLGTHLGHGAVVGDCIRCPLHHWQYDGAGICRRIPSTDAIPEAARQRAHPVEERHGMLFVYVGVEPPSPCPQFEHTPEDRLVVGVGKGVSLRCRPLTVLANAFDMQHLEAVHARALVEPPRAVALPDGRFVLDYVSRVTGTSVADRVMRRLSGDRIVVRITAWGPGVVTVESRAGSQRTALLLAITPTSDGCVVLPVVGIERHGLRPLDTLRLWTTRWLFASFLRRDVALLDAAEPRFKLLLPQDEVLGRFLEWYSAPAGKPTQGAPGCVLR